jgi:hypothetical protein
LSATPKRPAKLAEQAAWHRMHGRLELAELFEAQLVRTGRCKRCGRPLSDPESLERGVGPDCWAANAATYQVRDGDYLDDETGQP